MVSKVKECWCVMTTLTLRLCPLEHACAIDMNKFYLKEQRQLKNNDTVAIKHLMRFSPSCRLASILSHFPLLPVSACRLDPAVLRPDVLLLFLPSFLFFLFLLRALLFLFFLPCPSRSECNELLGHDVTARVPSTTFPPSLPHESSPFRCCACCPFCRCRSASADSGCDLVHALRCSTTVAWHSSDGCATSYLTLPPVRPGTPVALCKSDALTLREVCSPNSSCSTRELPCHPAV